MKKVMNKDKEQNKMIAILLILLSSFFYALMAVCAKSVVDIPATQKVFIRNALMSIVLLFPLLKKPIILDLNREQWKWLILRGGFGTIGVVSTFYIYDHMSLADSTIMAKLAPCFVFITSVILFREKVSFRNCAPLVISLAGAYLVIKPTFTSETWAALVAILCAVATGMARTMITKLGQLKVDRTIIMLSFSILSSVATLPFVIANYTPMSIKQFMLMLICTACTLLGQITLTAAYTRVSGKAISVFEYSQVVFAAVFDMLIFSMMPDGVGLIGYILIIGAAVYNAIVQMIY